uniref:NADH-ubiquinone oxidoreductase chain 4L n=1 Tax=Bryanellocoris orientalis TaxID=2813430 RepID=A0A8T9VZS1_9HEMI|nr:NADH dehydrogenase subunit 4L [Bryanellocoris orientalis]UPI55321.1 NADH dehydrogenase subunit 4L [Bryanellocoris orientalis]
MYSLFFMFVSGLFVFCSFRKHLLIMLFSIEYLVICLFVLFYMILVLYSFDLSVILYYLVFSVCEGSLGLGVLVNMIRSHGNDLLMSLSILSW